MLLQRRMKPAAFLPGPARSQLGFSLGLLRAGRAGAIAAFIGFTFPSALLIFAFATVSGHLAGPWGHSAVHGLKLMAVAVMAPGALGMARTLAPDAPRAMLAAAVGQRWPSWPGAYLPADPHGVDLTIKVVTLLNR